MSESMDDIIKLRNALDRVAADLHLKRIGFAIVPPEEDRPPYVKVMFSVLPEILYSLDEKEQLAFDESFSAIITAATTEPQEDPALTELKRLAAEAMEDEL